MAKNPIFIQQNFENKPKLLWLSVKPTFSIRQISLQVLS